MLPEVAPIQNNTQVVCDILVSNFQSAHYAWILKIPFVVPGTYHDPDLVDKNGPLVMIIKSSAYLTAWSPFFVFLLSSSSIIELTLIALWSTQFTMGNGILCLRRAPLISFVEVLFKTRCPTWRTGHSFWPSAGSLLLRLLSEVPFLWNFPPYMLTPMDWMLYQRCVS